MPKMQVNMKLWREYFIRVIFLTNHFLSIMINKAYFHFCCIILFKLLRVSSTKKKYKKNGKSQSANKSSEY